jgi:gliding motility-associated-like protein
MPSNPDVSGNSNLIGDSIIYCQNASATQLTATLNPSNNGGVLNWYTSLVGGTASSVAPTPSTLSVGTTYYYVSQTVSGIESGRSAIKIVVKPTPNQPNAISGSNTVLANTSYLYSVSSVSGATSYTWTLPNGWTGSSTTNSININTNSTTTGTILVTANLNSCSSVAQSLTIGTQPENPLSGLTGDSIIYCQGANALQLTASTNPANNGGVLNWYTSPTGGTPTTVAPTPSTLSAGITYYYVTQTVNGIESNRKAIKVIVKPIPNQPNMISGSNTVANNTNYTYSITTVPGATSYTWTLPNGWTGASTTNSISINTNSITSGTITVTANLNGCSSAAQTMTVGTLPSNPLTVLVGDSVVYCQGASASQLVASLNPSNNGGVLNWYTVATGGTASMSAPTPNTSIAGITYYYVSQTVNGIESGRTAVKVIVKPVPNQPNAISGPSSVMSNMNYIYSISTVPGATSYTWTLPNGWTGTSTSNSITINTNSTTSGTISVTSNLNDCSSTAQTLSIGAQPNAPLSGLVGDSIVYCQGVTTTQLTASTNPINNGGTLNWYTTPIGGTASGFAPTPSTTSSGTIYYYVSQTVNGIESNRTAIKIVVKPAPNQPNTISGSTSVSANTNYTYSVSSVSGATSYTWNLPNGWTGTSTINSILVTTNNTTSGIISVTANLNGCSSDAQTLTIGTLPNNPLSGLTGDSILYCQGAAATKLTASLNPLNNGGILKWYTTPTGGVASTSAPTPSTVFAGVYYYYVSQTVNGVESGRTAIKVVVKSVPNQPNPIQGDTLVAKGSSRTYAVAIVPGATSYTWTLPNGWTGTSTTNTITVVADSVGGVITVKANSENCSSLTQTLNVRVSINNDSDGDGIPDDIEKGNGTTPKDTDGDGTPDYLDPDSDNDGIPDSEEDSGCLGLSPCTPTDTDGDGNPDYTDTDSDNDGIPDSGEKGNGSTPKDTDGDGIPDYRDTDSDGDGIPDSIEKGSNGNNPKDTDGDGTPDYLDPDSDGDGIPDSIEKGSNGNTPKDSDGDGIPDYLDPDSDGDGIPDALEDTGCNGAVPCTPTDTDGDGIPDYLDPDSDNDGIPDSIEKGSGATPIDTDGDGIQDYRDLDSDGDGITDALEDTGCNGSVPCAPTDTDGDGKPDYLDLDSDGDGIPDSIEKGNGNTPQDTDGDGIPNYIDLDSDNDGILDAYENNVCIPTVALCDVDGDGIPNYMDLDSDNDSIPDVVESNGKDSDGDGRADGVSNPKGIPSSASNGNLPPNTDALGYADPYDLDSDNDGILDVIEKGSNGKKPRDSDGDGIPDYRDIDSDGDGNTDQGEGEISDCDGDGIPDYLDTDLCTDGEFPNYITPNGDGKNDNFVIPASYLKKHPGAKLIIYNRWGNVVWRSVGAYQNDWAGTHYDNNNLPDGVYYYLIELKDHFGEIKNGFVQIMRD